MHAFSIGSFAEWHVVHEFSFDAIAIVPELKSPACTPDKGRGAYTSGYLKKARAPMAPINRKAHTNNPIRHGRRRSPVGRQLNIAFPGRGFSVGLNREPQSSFSRVRFSQKTFSTSSSVAGCEAGFGKAVSVPSETGCAGAATLCSTLSDTRSSSASTTTVNGPI